MEDPNPAGSVPAVLIPSGWAISDLRIVCPLATRVKVVHKFDVTRSNKDHASRGQFSIESLISLHQFCYLS
ncbi:hypothetical protein SRL2020028_56880 [Mycobacterium kiyosense]|uniref:Uncharacterized protein n=1 Tax=Mycobacterium kiyosense TaxID=2871094 RepID=A0AA37V4E1_9MYCO|nr:hypothetical protein SRL2020028_56880 [Mycobacterium kiyosense]